VLGALRQRNDLRTDEVDDVIWGCSAQIGKQGTCIGRMSALDAGWSIKASGVTLDRFCGSGITAVNLAAASILSGMEDLDPSVPSDKGRIGQHRHFGAEASQCVHRLLFAEGPDVSARISTLEVTRRRRQSPGAASQQRRRAGIAGHFAKNLVPVLNDDGTVALDHDEYPRP
jgi:acetyl-CoA C-acetyltransferase